MITMVRPDHPAIIARLLCRIGFHRRHRIIMRGNDWYDICIREHCHRRGTYLRAGVSRG